MTKKILFLITFLLLSNPAWATDWCADATCQGCWLLDYDENPVRDDSQNEYTGALTAANNPDFIVSATFGGGYSFDGSGDQIDFGSVSEAEGSPVSVVAWVYNDNVTQDHHIIGTWKAGSPGIFLWADDDASISHRTNTYSWFVNESTASGNSNVRIEGATNAAVAGSWQHVAATFTAGNNSITLYINGVADTNTPETSGYVNNAGGTDADNLTLGETNAGSYDRLGDLDEIALFDTTLLDSDDINDIMTNGLVQAAPPAGMTQIIMNLM